MKKNVLIISTIVVMMIVSAFFAFRLVKNYASKSANNSRIETKPNEQEGDSISEASVVKDSLYGFVIGDAMGVPIEFKTREELMMNKVTTMLGYGTYNVPEGTWSDDTSMTLATMDSMIKNKGKININDIADRFCNWYNNAEYTATNKVFDIGNQTVAALHEYQSSKYRIQKSGENFSYSLVDVNKNGNGSLMRMLPVALYCYYNNLSYKDVLNVVRDISAITHPHERSVMGCYIYVRYVMFLLDGKDKVEAYNMVRSLDYSMFSKDSNEVYARILQEDISKINIDDIKSSGYVVHTLEAVMWGVLNCDNYNDSIITAINLGDDTDTVGAITGSISGILYGYDTMNKEWVSTLKNRKYLDNIIRKFESMLKMDVSKK